MTNQKINGETSVEANIGGTHSLDYLDKIQLFYDLVLNHDLQQY